MTKGTNLESPFNPVMCDFLDNRKYHKTMSELKTIGDETNNPGGAELYPEGYIAICGDEDGAGFAGQYQYYSTNSFDDETGKWRNIHKDPNTPVVDITAPLTVAKKVNEWDDVEIKYDLNEKGTPKATTTIKATLTPKDAPITKWAIYLGDGTTPIKEEILDEDDYIKTETEITYTHSTEIDADTTIKVVATDGNKKEGVDIVYLQFNFKKFLFLVKPDVEAADITETMIKAATLPTAVVDQLWKDKAYKWENIETIDPDDNKVHLMKTVYAYPKAYGELTEVLDRNELSLIDSFDVEEVNVKSAADVSIDCDYYVYVFDHGIKCEADEGVVQNYI